MALFVRLVQKWQELKRLQAFHVSRRISSSGMTVGGVGVKLKSGNFVNEI